MKTADGIKVIEFNARFGDPETEVVLPLLESDAFELFDAVAAGRPVDSVKWSDEVTMGVVMASRGYPGHYDKGFEIRGLESVGAHVYHMGTALRDGRIVTNGGRVLMPVCRGRDIAEARKKVYDAVSRIECDNLFYRNDIAHQAL